MIDWIERSRHGQDGGACIAATQALSQAEPGKTFRARHGSTIIATFKDGVAINA